MQRLAKEPGVRVAILTGEGRAFCVGADLKERAWESATQSENRARIGSQALLKGDHSAEFAAIDAERRAFREAHPAYRSP